MKKHNLDLRHFPNFFIIGPQRTGTTWLYENLVQHPNVFLSRKKELYFFNLLNKPEHPLYRTSDLSVYLKNFYDTPSSLISKKIKCYLKYKQLYRPIVRGEATASYAAMEEDLIAEVTTLNPEIKAILMIRDPIERAWSHAKKDLVKKRKVASVESIPKNELENFFKDDYQLACGNYTVSIDKWSKYLLKGNLFLGIFDDIVNSPNELLKNIYLFLGVNADTKYSSFEKKIINPTKKEKLPRDCRNMLHEIFEEEIERLNSRYGLRWHS